MPTNGQAVKIAHYTRSKFNSLTNKDSATIYYVEETDGKIKQYIGNTHVVSDNVPWTGVSGKPTWIGSSKPAYTASEVGAAPTSHTHSIAQVTGLQTALDGKGTSNLIIGTTSTTAKAGNYHPTWSQVTSKPTWIGSSKPAYTASEVGARPAGNVSWTEVSGKPSFAPVNAQKNSDITKSEIETSLGFTPENSANKLTTVRTTGANDTSYVSELGVKKYVDGLIGSVYRPAGDWNANTNSPTLANDTQANAGKVYRVSVAGTRFGFTFAIGDKLAFNESGVISKWDNVDDVTSVAGKTGAVVLVASDVGARSSSWTPTWAQVSGKPTFATVATSGSYADLSNKPSIPAAQVQSNWNATTGMGVILNKPALKTVATSGSYADLTDKPSIPSIPSTMTTTEGNTGTATTQRTINAANLKSIILNHSPAGARPSSWGSVSGKPTFATVATSGSYADLSNKPTIPAAQVAVNWNATSGITAILNKPNLATVATSGSYNDLSNKLTAGTNITIDANNVISASGGGGTYELTKTKIDTALKGAGNSSTQLGQSATASGMAAIAVGQGATANEYASISVGYGANASGGTSITLGADSSATGDYSIVLGQESNATKDYSIAIGAEAYAGGNYSTAIGYSATTGTSQNMMRLGNTSLATLSSKVQLTVTSDIRDKADIEEVPKALDFIKDLNPITYVSNDRDHYISEEQKETETYKDYLMVEDYDKGSHSQGTKKGSRRRVGLSAQEVRDKLIEHYGSDNYANVVNDNFVEFEERDLDIPEGLENKLSMSYETLVPFLIKAIQEQQEQIEELKNQINSNLS